ncbi:hypothetical protein JRG19_04835 [Pseudoclavibacter alba]|uniref:Uncharacterized protein n=1 Tax=Pseudoclavibacter albus TaxID=272241 RepID=A0ABT2HWF6_9MICO|nr:hypothetical protein [Pseudoclavibacter alba]MBN6777874.1 hypothetical protein [Pseudoclavibacter alba]MCT2042465.1 hypothetical protein [Pseudoclavibacter alba]
MAALWRDPHSGEIHTLVRSMRRRIASIAATAAATLLAATGLVTFEPIEVETPDIAGGYAPDVCEQYECYTFYSARNRTVD